MDSLRAPYSLLTLNQNVPELLKAAHTASVGEEGVLNYPEGLTYKATAEISLYTHRGQDSWTLVVDWGALTPDTLPGLILVVVDRPEGSAGDLQKGIYKT
jgi:hypothetical protein